MKAVTFGLLASLALLSPISAYAKHTCTIDNYQSVDIAPDTSGGVLDEETGQFLITQKPPMRCATITFTTSKTRDRIASQMNGSFEATYFDNKTARSHSVTFDEDQLKAGYIRIGPNDPVEAYVCFTTSDTPIKDISCDID
ncbi:hypothetical protein VISI1226_02647 [Vibrio sinaloensis DSM 21326]|uniref:Uncharacterized protein n=1 Tax=Vibrio sinaloensis DSM 21326 TaxID=945550 RepID=E8M9E0_PHOS4|nr:hypothetical protein [Vibrio sinaloensis]EGA69307.1 hypothetical protein VISI1226_02647 [Vibrio sinaloensis DSM 21326]